MTALVLVAASCAAPPTRDATAPSEGSVAAPSVPSPSHSPGHIAVGSAGVPTFSHVVVVVMENREYGQVIGSLDAPYVNGLARRGALSTDFHAITHPSLPNYLALLGGSTFGVTSDCTDCNVAARSLVDELEANGLTWKAYMQDLPSPCFTGASSGSYAKKHDPFMYFTRIVSNPGRCARVAPLDGLATDLAHHRLADFVWITPDLCHDGHNCSTRFADDFLSRTLPPILQQLGPSGVLFLTWDEGTSDAGCCANANGGHIATVVAGPLAKPGARSNAPEDQYSILRTIEDSWELGRLGATACSCTRPMWDLIRAAA